ncbi:Disease resistance protein [Acorus gramineus]|uniref:Disease resistance protein n=1 Tax=Acorus gramineus TaxID=55184 RepID=A0AAV9A370_ACOGR|nr:Disease resistance protein [Acorus gramineus]
MEGGKILQVDNTRGLDGRMVMKGKKVRVGSTIVNGVIFHERRMGIAIVGIIIQALSCCFPPTVQAAKYVFHRANYCLKLKKKFQVVEDKMTTLTKIREDVRSETRKTRLTGVCEAWLQKVESIEKKVNNIRAEYYITMESNCLSGCCPNVYARYNYGKLLMQTTDEILALSEESKTMDKIANRRELRAVESMPVKRFEEQTTMSHTLKELFTCLKTREFKRIGVWGMPGVGKTTLMGTLNNLMDDEMFDIVIWVTVSKDWSPRKVQDDIARRLKLNVEKDESDTSVAGKLHSYLKSKRYLLLLDDVWKKIDLLSIGIPNCEELDGCKVILASRDLKVCNQMGTDRNVKLETLQNDEARRLFLEKVGEVSPCIHSEVFEKILEQCGNLPLAIVTVGMALRRKYSKSVWNDTLRSLLSPAVGKTDLDEMYELLRFSYDQLSDDIKNCFLYAALYPDGHDIYIDDLIEYWKAEGFFEDCKSFADAHDRGRHILETLLDASMLQRSTRPEHVQMHQMLRDVAMKIAFPNGESPKFLVKTGVKKQQIPEEKEWEQVERISLMSSDLNSKLPRAHNFILAVKSSAEGDPRNILCENEQTRVVDLSNTEIQFLPKSLFALSNLRGLNLNGCRHLKAFPSLKSYLLVPFVKYGHLENLELLDIRGTGITCLATEVRKFPTLRSLKVSSTNFADYVGKAATIPQQLEELIIDVERNDTQWNSKAQALVHELVKLENLNALRFFFPDVECFKRFTEYSVAWPDRSWRAFQFIVGLHDGGSKLSVGRWSGYLRFAGGASIPQGVQATLKHANAFELLDHEVVQDLSEFGMKNMYGLESCRVEGCKEIEYIFVGDDITLPCLKKLHAIDLPKLEGIWKGIVPQNGLASLMLLDLRRCPSLTMVLTLSAAQQLCLLEELRVKNCSNITEVVGYEETVKEGSILPKLKIMILNNLPKLDCIHKEESPLLTWRALEKIQINNSPVERAQPRCPMYNSGRKGMVDALKWKDSTLQEKFQLLYKSDE